MSYLSPAPLASWPTLAEFYAQDLRRGRSHELEIGSLWRNRDVDPPWRAAWLEATGEFVVVGRAAAPAGPPGPVELLGVLPDRYTLEVGLRGWWQVCGEPGALTWLRHAVGRLGAPAEPDPSPRPP